MRCADWLLAMHAMHALPYEGMQWCSCCLACWPAVACDRLAAFSRVAAHYAAEQVCTYGGKICGGFEAMVTQGYLYGVCCRLLLRERAVSSVQRADAGGCRLGLLAALFSGWMLDPPGART